MIKRFKFLVSGDGLRARAVRGFAVTFLSFGGTNVIRLLSNLILTRLLFPEAFGLMALVQVFIGGLQMFSDIGITTSITANPRGDDPDFLNTAWTLQIGRGVMLWLAACALALPAAWIYSEPMLAQLLPVVGLNALIAGFTTTKVLTANRHLRLGRQTFISLGCQVFGILVTVVLAWLLHSVWALVFGGLVAASVQRSLMHLLMPGIKNHLHWDPSAAWDMISFGKYIFLSTVAGFVISQGDRAILGGYISTAELGIYNMGYFLGAVPLLLGRAVSSRVVFPLYRMRPPAESQANRKQIFRARRMVIFSVLLCTVPLGFGGTALVDFLYDSRYILAGPIVTLMCLGIIPQIIFVGYGGVLLANGDSRRHFILLLSTAVIQLVYLFLGISWWGIFGAIIAPGLASLTTYPMRTWFVSHYKANDNLADALFILVGGGLNGLACWMNWDVIQTLIK